VKVSATVCLDSLLKLSINMSLADMYRTMGAVNLGASEADKHKESYL